MKRDLTIAACSFLTAMYLTTTWLLRGIDLSDYR